MKTLSCDGCGKTLPASDEKLGLWLEVKYRHDDDDDLFHSCSLDCLIPLSQAEVVKERLAYIHECRTEETFISLTYDIEDPLEDDFYD